MAMDELENLRNAPANEIDRLAESVLEKYPKSDYVKNEVTAIRNESNLNDKRDALMELYDQIRSMDCTLKLVDSLSYYLNDDSIWDESFELKKDDVQRMYDFHHGLFTKSKSDLNDVGKGFFKPHTSIFRDEFNAVSSPLQRKLMKNLITSKNTAADSCMEEDARKTKSYQELSNLYDKELKKSSSGRDAGLNY